MKEKKHFFLLLFYVLLLPHQELYAQNTFTADIYNTEFGLPSNFIQACKMDSIGYLWVATKKGICRYDGYFFQQYPALSGNILSLEKRNNDEFVFNSNNSGLAAFNPYSMQVTKIASTQFTDDDPYNDHYNNIFTDDAGRIWCCDFANVKYYDPLLKKTKSFAISNYNNSTDKLATFTQPDKLHIWIASIFGLQIWDNKNNSLQPSSNAALSHLNFSASAMVGNDSLILAAGNKVFLVKPSTQEIILQKQMDASGVIVSISIANIGGEKNILFASKNKLYAFAGTSPPAELFSMGQYNGTVNTIFCDATNAHIWISSSQGLIKLTAPADAITQINLPLSTSLSENLITSVIRQPHTEDFFVTTSLGQCYRTDLKKKWIKIVCTQPVNSVCCGTGEVYLATAAGLYSYSGNACTLIDLGKENNKLFIKKVLIAAQYIWLLIKDKPVIALNRKALSVALGHVVAANEIFSKNNVWNDLRVISLPVTFFSSPFMTSEDNTSLSCRMFLKMRSVLMRLIVLLKPTARVLLLSILKAFMALFDGKPC